MTVLTTDTFVVSKQRGFRQYPMADNVKIQKGQFVCLNTSGYAVQAADTSGYQCVGWCEEAADNTITGHTAGGVNVKVRTGQIYLGAVGTGFTQASVGATAYIVDANTLGVAGSVTNKVVVGEIVGYNSATSIDVDVTVPLPTLATAGTGAQKTATVTLTGGTDTGGGLGSWANPEASEIMVTLLVITSSVVATAACNIDAGTTATSATTLSDNLIDGQDIHSATLAGVSNYSAPGTNGKSNQALAAGKWVTFSTGDAGASAGFAGKAYITYSVLN